MDWFSGQLTHMLEFAGTKREAEAICRRKNREWGNDDQYCYVERIKK